jgi:hypothetical protein
MYVSFGKDKTFRHSGDLGDIIFSLPAVRALGGGILYLDPEGGESSPLVKYWDKTRTRLNAQTITSLKPLLLRQPYVKDVRFWAGEAVDYHLDEWRRHGGLHNISDSHLAAFGLPSTERDRAWLEFSDPIRIEGKPIVLARSVRSQSNYSYWEWRLPSIKHQSVFVGLPKEYEIFVYTFGHEVTYYPTPDILTLARVIAGCELFIGNQSLPHALAEAMKKRLVNEYFRPDPAAIFRREGAEYV